MSPSSRGAHSALGSLLHYTSILTFLKRKKKIRPREDTFFRASTSNTQKQSGQPPKLSPDGHEALHHLNASTPLEQVPNPGGRDADPPVAGEENQTQRCGVTAPGYLGTRGQTLELNLLLPKTAFPLPLAGGSLLSPPRNWEEIFTQTGIPL